MKKVIITGATSMVGIAIIEACLEKKIDRIYAIIREGCVKRERIPKDSRIIIIECNIDKYYKLLELISENCDVFYHIAWSVTGNKRNEDILGQSQNIQYTLNALDIAKKLGCKKFVGAGSQAEYGPLNIEKINENSIIKPIQPYGIAKYAAGKLGMEEAKRIGIDFLWVRIFSIYGKYDKPTTMVSSTVRKILAGEKASFTKGEQKWDYLYSSDAGNAFVSIGEKANGYNVYNLGSGIARPLYEYINIIKDSVNKNAVIGIGDLPYPSNAIMNLCADISKLYEATGWRPTVSFEEGIKLFIQEIKSEQKFDKKM